MHIYPEVVLDLEVVGMRSLAVIKKITDSIDVIIVYNIL